MKRLNLVLSDDEYDLIYTLAELRGESMSKLVLDVLTDFFPGWRREVGDLHEIRRRELQLEDELARMKQQATRLRKKRPR